VSHITVLTADNVTLHSGTVALLSFEESDHAVRNRLRVLRAEYRWTQAELARRLGVSRQTVNAIETGRFDPSLPLAFRIAQLFELSIEQVFQPEEVLQAEQVLQSEQANQ
jgi:putative transcriptional regulator